MKVAIEVKNRGEADAIRTGLADSTTRAFVVVVGTLMPLSVKDRRRVMDFVGDKLSNEASTADESQPSLKL